MFGLFLLNADGERAAVAYAVSDSQTALENVAAAKGLEYWIILCLDL
jgi:hypothetical protein